MRYLLLLLGWFGICGSGWSTAAAAEPPATGPGDDTRGRDVAAARAALDTMAKAHGGWDAWHAAVRPWREDAWRVAESSKWPWPAERGFVFQGGALRALTPADLNAAAKGAPPVDAIVHLDRQLKARGIDLIVVPIPSKLAVYPDYLSDKAPGDRGVAVPVLRLMRDLAARDVEVIDLYTPFAEHRAAHEREGTGKADLYYQKDSHWLNRGAVLAAEAVAERLGRYDFAQAAEARKRFAARPAARDDGNKADDDLRHILDTETGEHYQDIDDAPVVITGDSFSMYNLGTAHLAAQVAYELQQPVTALYGTGMGANMPVRLAELARDRDYLDGRRVIVWTLVDRFFDPRKPSWRAVDLPAPADAEPRPAVRGVAATATVVATSPAPPADPPYDRYVMKLHVRGLTDAAGEPVGDGEAVLRMLALDDRKPLPAATLEPGDGVAVNLTSWRLVEDDYGTLMTGVLDHLDAELSLPHYWAAPRDE